MYEVYVSSSFEAAHALAEGFGPASRLHGHTYRLEVVVRGQRLSEDGVLVDIGELRPAVEHLSSSLHYRNLDEIEGLSQVNTTAENVASYCWEQLAPVLGGKGLQTLLVRVWESPEVYGAREDLLPY